MQAKPNQTLQGVQHMETFIRSLWTNMAEYQHRNQMFTLLFAVATS